MKCGWILGLVVSLLLSLFNTPIRAKEGMYPLHDAKALPLTELKQAGLTISAEQLIELKRSVAKVGRGGSGSFVSNQGLLVTNHHVAFRCLAELDGMDRHKGIVKKGFVARSLAQEIPCPGYDLMVVQSVEDVTAEVNAAVKPRYKGHKRFEALRLAQDDIEKKCLSQGKGRFCDVEPLDGGRFYHLLIYKLIKDVRLVYAPEQDLGKYGGNIDNWMYPRHTADYTFLRAYVDRQGQGASFATENVPYQPEVFLKVSDEGVAKGDFVSVLGFPARTKRHYPARSAKFAVQTEMPLRRKIYGDLIKIIKQVGNTNERAARRYQGLSAGLNNATKYYDQSLNGFAKWKTVEKRVAHEQKISQALAAKKDGAKKKLDRLTRKIDAIYKNYENEQLRYFMLTGLGRITRSVGTAFDIATWTEERVKPDRDRKDDRYKDQNTYRMFGSSDRLDEQIELEAERALLTYVLQENEKVAPPNRVRAAAKLIKWGKKELKRVKREARKAKKEFAAYYEALTGAPPTADPVQTAVDLMFARTRLVAHDRTRDELERALFQRRRLFFNEVKKAKRFKDPLLDFARALVKEKKKLKKGAIRDIEETFETELRPQFVELMGAAYPDANFQIRLSFGRVDDYKESATGKTHRYVTDMRGLIAKDKGKFPFNVPAKVKQLAKGNLGRFADKQINDVPINFTTTLDTTGGNSGSPVLDGQGRLVGLLFDGTPESILSDWQFLPDDQRSICVDIRYALFLAEKLHHADSLLKELGI